MQDALIDCSLTDGMQASCGGKRPPQAWKPCTTSRWASSTWWTWRAASACTSQGQRESAWRRARRSMLPCLPWVRPGLNEIYRRRTFCWLRHTPQALLPQRSMPRCWLCGQGRCRCCMAFTANLSACTRTGCSHQVPAIARPAACAVRRQAKQGLPPCSSRFPPPVKALPMHSCCCAHPAALV
jgi:hypothetical protein